MTSPKQKPAPPGRLVGRELTALERIGKLIADARFDSPVGETWFGDDAAVLTAPPVGLDVLSCSDSAVAGVHADLAHLTLADLGWRAVAATLSDIAAMGGRPWRMVVSVSTPPNRAATEIMEGAVAAAAAFGCPIVGGDLTSSPEAVVSVAALGLVPVRSAVLRSGASEGDVLFVTGPVGGSAAGLRTLRAGDGDSPIGAPLIESHCRPRPLFAEGEAARRGGATAMIDISDGLSLDAVRLGVASGLGVALDTVPIAEGATEAEALGGGEDYELLIAVKDPDRLVAMYGECGLTAPLHIGRLTKGAGDLVLRGERIEAQGWVHDVS